MQTKCILCAPILISLFYTRVAVYAECIYMLTQYLRSAAAWLFVNYACVPHFLNSLLTPRFVQIFSGNSSVNLFAVHGGSIQTQTFYQYLVLVAE